MSCRWSSSAWTLCGHPGDQPGLGVTLARGLASTRWRDFGDLDAAAKYRYEQAYLPYSRLTDGTVHDW
ncbi:hypothetical protein [Jiangella alkaliphila]|uniref:hypothetical protein n=1 Tax=Jiangella alkaliphila TaxID=419479 RepID=UPI000629CDDE|nr:hypothetical protein [Jiangella alkaliphila]